jgi:uncharacterized HAD superfamily protein
VRFCFDIDGVLVTTVEKLDYMLGEPMHENIALVNRLYYAGHHITLYTARGTLTGIDWRERTEQQMKKFGVLYHELVMGKPAANYYVDDKLTTMEELRRMGH